MTTNANEKLLYLPETEKAIKAEFPGRDNAGFRKILKGQAYGGDIGNCRDIALTACGEASLAEVRRVYREEMRASGLYNSAGYPIFEIGENEHGEPVAFLDQPVETYGD